MTNKKSKGKLKISIGLGLTIIAVIISVASCFIGYHTYKIDTEKYYNDKAYNLAYLVQSNIDGDKISYYLETLETDPEYDQTLDYLENLRYYLEANYIYIAALENGTDLTYVFDADNPNDAYEPFALGDTGSINPEFTEDAILIVTQGIRSDNYFYSESEFGYNTSAIVPVYDSNNTIVAIIGVEFSMQNLYDMLSEYVLTVFTLTPIIIFILIAIFSLYVTRKIIIPIENIEKASTEFMEAKEVSTVSLDKVTTHDELENLAKAVKQMQIDTLHYIDNIQAVTSERERIGAELNIAKNIQEDMLPAVFPKSPEIPFIKLYASMTPAKEVGGDFYDFFDIDGDNIGLVIADVSGKGIAAALFMVIAKTLLKNAAQSGLSPKEIFEKVNDELCEHNRAEMFVTAWLGIFNTKTGHITAVNAGHEYPVIKRKGGEFELFKDRHGFVLAGMEHMKYRQYEMDIYDGDTLFLYTDGVPEATNSKNELYGLTRMLEKLNECGSDEPKELLEFILEDAMKFTGSADQFDDITMLSVTKSDSNIIFGDKDFIPSESDVTAVTEFVQEIIQKSEVSKTIQNKIAIVIDEIYSNILYYSGADKTSVSCNVTHDKITITFRDNGKQYNPLEKADADTSLSADERELGGLGILIVKKTMDHMKYKYLNGQNILMLEKTL